MSKHWRHYRYTTIQDFHNHLTVHILMTKRCYNGTCHKLLISVLIMITGSQWLPWCLHLTICQRLCMTCAACYNSLITFGWLLGEWSSKMFRSLSWAPAAATAFFTTGTSSSTLVCGPHGPMTLPLWSIRYFQKFQSGAYPVCSKYNNTKQLQHTNNCRNTTVLEKCDQCKFVFT